MPVASGWDIRALFDNAPCGLLVTDADSTIRLANETFCRWTSYDKTALIGQRKLQELLSMGGRVVDQTHWATLLQLQGSVSEVKLDLCRQDGSTVPMLMNAVRREQAGSVRHECAFFVADDRGRDEQEAIDARRRTEAEGRAAFAEQMLGIVSHDLRNPLSAINLTAHVLARGELTAKQREAVDRILRAVTVSRRLIDDLLDFTQARIGGGLQVDPRAMDLHKTVAQTVDELRTSFPGRLLVHTTEGTGATRADANRVAQLVGNLVSNAMTHGCAQGTVTVTTQVQAQTSELAIHNTGRPIPAEVIPTLFDPMTRGTDMTPSHSVGLGLFIVREIVRAHGGHVCVTSSAEQGTTFVVSLPAGRSVR